jgi:tetrahydromethanopterin S-methyltransferase subunit C
MTAKMEASAGKISHNTLMTYGIVVAVVGTYLTLLNGMTGVAIFSFFGGVAAVAALWWGSDTIKHLCSYGLGTGVPSAGMIAFGSGSIAMIVGTKFGIASPIATLVIAAILGAVIGYTANNIINMNIPVMVMSLMELCIVGAMTMLGFATMCTGSFTFSGMVAGGIGSLIGGSALAVIFFLGALALQHPFNACLGPNESQDRTLMLALSCGFLSMIAVAVISFVFVGLFAGTISLIISLIAWLYCYKEYIALSKRDAYAWLDAKPIIEVGGDN